MKIDNDLIKHLPGFLSFSQCLPILDIQICFGLSSFYHGFNPLPKRSSHGSVIMCSWQCLELHVTYKTTYHDLSAMTFLIFKDAATRSLDYIKVQCYIKKHFILLFVAAMATVTCNSTRLNTHKKKNTRRLFKQFSFLPFSEIKVNKFLASSMAASQFDLCPTIIPHEVPYFLE